MSFDYILQTAVSLLTLVSLIGGFAYSIYNSNKNRILADQKHKQEAKDLHLSMTALSEEVTATNKRLEKKIDAVTEKVEEHAHFEGKIANLEGRVRGLEQLVSIIKP